MESNTLNKTKQRNIDKYTEEIAMEVLLNVYLREVKTGHRFYIKPQYDKVIADYFEETEHQKWMKISLNKLQKEIFCPLAFYSETGRHQYLFPIVVRNNQTDELNKVNLSSLAELFYNELQENQEIAVNLELDELISKVKNSAYNMAQFVKYREDVLDDLATIHEPFLSFQEAEQSLLTGHSMHPFSKTRGGWDFQALMTYSPDTKASFQLHYFLIDEKYLCQEDYQKVSDYLKKELFTSDKTNENVKDILLQHHQKMLIPAHPWEAVYLQKFSLPTIQLIKNEKLISLGLAGEEYTATSSVRTLYRKESPYMFKFSLHVQITNAERLNTEVELKRGHQFSELKQTMWGKQLTNDFPTFETVDDPAYFSLLIDQENAIEGFNTIVRKNPFGQQHDNVSLIASFCQDPLLDYNPRLYNTIAHYALQSHQSYEEASLAWFQQYLKLTLVNFVNIFNKYGLVCEVHQQNVLLQLDKNAFPQKIYYRDNQGYFFRENLKEKIVNQLPSLENTPWTFLPDEVIFPKYTYYLFVNNILGVINAFGRAKLIDEKDLIEVLYTTLQTLKSEDKTGYADYLLNSRDLTIKANFLTKIANMDEVRQPMDNPAIYKDMPNPLMLHYFSPSLIKPQTLKVVDERYYEDKDIVVTIRSFDISKDLPIVHDWFNQEHTKTFWKMDGSLKELEKFYIEILESEETHSFIGEVNGKPIFTFEPYWSMRDRVGAYYDALPTDVGIHLLIAPTEKSQKYTFHLCCSLMSFSFNQPNVGKIIGEADVDMRPMHMLVSRIGFKFQYVLELPYKTANLTFCTRATYLERFPNEKV